MSSTKLESNNKTNPIDIPNNDIKRINSKNNALNLFSNCENLYYSSEINFPPNNNPPSKNKDNYSKLFNNDIPFSPSSYENFKISKYF